ncbi:DUF1573 domain-containing protein [Pedobacter sp. P351]|uniref:DUF1573 domain-containing protein n=1 Tax=Pedobacter superstes TaxID=3133441 RepID=UPI00309EB475
MKKLFTFCAVILSFVAITAMKAGVEAEFKFEEETHDFGKITQGKPVTYEFKFTNVGDSPIIISNVEASCGCTVPKYSSTPVKKGEAGVITATFNAAAVGSFNKVITVKSNAKTPVKYLYIKGEVVSTSSR